MYSTCLFCHGPLGRNEALEDFPVGRRIAYDLARGRLWVVCPRCERWNLTPLESRWEAMEEAERLFRPARLRMATENIALARLKEGLDLVRIGAPPRLELAGWRYGDQFGRRRRKFIALTALGGAVGLLPMIGYFGLGLGVVFVGIGVQYVYGFMDWRKWRRASKIPTILLKDDNGNPLPLTEQDTWSATLVPIPTSREWYLRLRHRVLDPAGPNPSVPSRSKVRAQAPEPAVLWGAAAYRALATLLPHASPAGGSARTVRDAVAFLESHASIEQLTYRLATLRGTAEFPTKPVPITRLPGRARLALEMVLHEDDERRAMEGALALLEQRWREAEEIASIADGLLLPADMETRLEALRRR